jgi:transposase
MHCRYCGSEKTHKSGKIRGKQRYKCKDCGKNFLETDGRTKDSTTAKRALAVMLYTFSKASYNFLAKKIFHCSPTTVMNWIKKASAEVKMPEITNDIKEIEFDEMWHFIGSKKTKNGSSKLLIANQEKLLPGLRVTVMLQPSENYITKSNT